MNRDKETIKALNKEIRTLRKQLQQSLHWKTAYSELLQKIRQLK